MATCQGMCYVLNMMSIVKVVGRLCEHCNMVVTWLSHSCGIRLDGDRLSKDGGSMT